MYLLDAPDDTLPGFREAWRAVGDSIVIVGGDGLWNCHIHTNDIGAAIEAGVEAGRPHAIRVTDLFEQVEEEQWVRDASGAGGNDVVEVAPLVATAVVAVGVGDGVRRLLRSLGVQQVVAGGQSMNPSTAQILEAVDACNADAVIVLPNNKNIIAVARQVDDLTAKHVGVVPTQSVPEALAALVEYDPNAPAGENERMMSEAVEKVHTGEVTQAVRDAAAEFGPIKSRRLDRAVARRHRLRRHVGGRRGVLAARVSRRRRQRDRHGARRVRRARQRDRTHPRARRGEVPAGRDRVPRRWSAAVPVPRRGRVASYPLMPIGDPPLTFADLRAIELGAA